MLFSLLVSYLQYKLLIDVLFGCVRLEVGRFQEPEEKFINKLQMIGYRESIRVQDKHRLPYVKGNGSSGILVGKNIKRGSEMAPRGPEMEVGYMHNVREISCNKSANQHFQVLGFVHKRGIPQCGTLHVHNFCKHSRRIHWC